MKEMGEREVSERGRQKEEFGASLQRRKILELSEPLRSETTCIQRI